jgi:hypothetical protein
VYTDADRLDDAVSHFLNFPRRGRVLHRPRSCHPFSDSPWNKPLESKVDVLAHSSVEV